jgi:hypothetical protein
MKKTILEIILLITPFIIYSQKVDSIRVEQIGDVVKVHYKILYSSSSQVFKVAVLCSVNGGLKSELNSLSGDFGTNVSGGRNDYLIIWDALKDIDEIKSVDFTIRAELVKDNLQYKSDFAIPIKEKKLSLLLIAQLPDQPKFGIKFCILKNWGGTIMFLGDERLFKNLQIGTTAISFNLTKRILNAKNIKLHTFLGPMIQSFWLINPNPNYYSYDQPKKTLVGLEGGLILTGKRLSFSLGLNPFRQYLGDGTEIQGLTHIGTLGLGLML